MGMTAKSAVMKFMEYAVISLVAFWLWVWIFGWMSYFGFGAIVAGYLMMKQLKKWEHGGMLYGLVFLADMVFWPPQIYVDIRNSDGEAT